ncbi:MAG: L,D-transpeptidase family protein [Alphaproteobacteria bacterium]
MHYWMPFFVMILLTLVLFFSTGCSSSAYTRRTPPPPKYDSIIKQGDEVLTKNKINKQLEAMRNKNFSVLRTEMVMSGMSMDNPMLIRAFKSEMQLELWVQNSYTKQYDLFRTYNVCKKSGALGPKLQEGDLQTPEGFYSVTKDRLNPNSQYFLSFNIGYPNEYDQSHGRTGSLLMIHGNCVSEGCLAMTDKQIGEIYLIIEQNFKYGHPKIPVNIYPFRMTAANMAMRKNSQWHPFWKNLKQGYDYFETYRTPPDISVRSGKYVIEGNRYY